MEEGSITHILMSVVTVTSQSETTRHNKMEEESIQEKYY